nr:TniB family NTP-binding protein [uncultured Tolumonas sp.]
MFNSKVPFALDGDLMSRVPNAKLPRVAREFYDLALNHAQFNHALESLGKTHAMSGMMGCGMILDGDPGLGKTTALNVYVRSIYDQECYQPTDTLTPLPVLKVRLPGRPTIPRVIEKLLLTSNHLLPTSRKSQTLEHRLHQLITRQQVEMIIFDEYQHLLRKHAQITTNDTVNFIKVLADDYKLAIVFAGLPEGREILSNFPELNERMSFESARLTAFNIESGQATQEYARYIIGIQEHLDRIGVKICSLADQGMLIRILLATQGSPRFINRLFMRLLMRFGDQKKITIKEFEQEYSSPIFGGHLGLFNPFSATDEAVLEKLNELKAGRNSKHSKIVTKK